MVVLLALDKDIEDGALGAKGRFALRVVWLGLWPCLKHSSDRAPSLQTGRLVLAGHLSPFMQVDAQSSAN